jgi:RimJ/RimL family protein N-acetyltransferase
MSSGPFLLTERLILRPPSAEDFEAWAAFNADPETMHHLGGVNGRGQAWRTLCTMVGAWQVRGYAMFSMILRDNGQWIGRTGPWMPEGWPGTEVGWGVAREFAGKGYAHEAAVASIDYAFDVLGWDKVIHTIDPANTASIALAKKLGAYDQGLVHLPDPFEHIPVHAWGQSKTEWAARKAAQA